MIKQTTAEMNRLSVEAFRLAKKLPVVVVLDNIRSQNNIGAVFRTADAFRLRSLILCGITATPPHREIHKTALGATDSVEWSYSETTTDAVNRLKSEGFTIIAVEQTTGSIPLNEYKPLPGQKLAVIFGNEVNGVDEALLPLCDAAIEIPQYGTKHSINVSVAVGIVIWDIFSSLKNSIF
jgi:tRNA G18 (ribose-2'-O)-methylase SpoU